MDIDILKHEKDEIEFSVDSVTLAEIIRVYLNEDSSVTFVAWKRDHATKPPVLLVKTKGKAAKKAVDDAIKAIVKDIDSVEKDFKKMK